MTNVPVVEHDNYFFTRFPFDERRDVIWKEVCRYLQRYVPADATVLDLGAGYCNFINNIAAAEKHAVDLFSELANFAGPDVITHNRPCTTLTEEFEDGTFDVAFASNLFEHLTREELLLTLQQLARVLRPGGTLIALQPNFRLCYDTYFDDFTHIGIFTDRSLPDLFELMGFSVTDTQARFLPVNMKDTLRVPVPGLPFWVRLYLSLPYRPRAGQMLVVGRNRGTEG